MRRDMRLSRPRSEAARLSAQYSVFFWPAASSASRASPSVNIKLSPMPTATVTLFGTDEEVLEDAKGIAEQPQAVRVLRTFGHGLTS